MNHLELWPALDSEARFDRLLVGCFTSHPLVAPADLQSPPTKICRTRAHHVTSEYARLLPDDGNSDVNIRGAGRFYGRS